MRYQLKEYHRPTDWKEAHRLLTRPDITTAPLFLSPRPQAPEDWQVQAVVDLSALGAADIREEDNILSIGLAASLQSLVESPLLKQRWQGILNRCAGFAGTLGLRNYANLGGLLRDPAAPGEVTSALLCLDAQVIYRQPDGKLAPRPLADFITSPYPSHPEETAVSVSISGDLGGCLAVERVGRTLRDIATLAVVTRLVIEGGKAVSVHLAAAGASPHPQRITPVEDLLAGKTITPDLLDEACSAAQTWANPKSDMRGSATYRKAMAGTLTRRALQSASHSNP
jgi:CO/xanthine dehydrogenase FAD-binding subunit